MIQNIHDSYTKEVFNVLRLTMPNFNADQINFNETITKFIMVEEWFFRVLS